MKPEKHRATADERQPAIDRETRRDILRAAAALFIERGFKGVSMKDVADAVAVTPAALYYHFPGGKEELFAATIRHLLEETMERAFLALGSAVGLRERLIQLTRNVLALPVDRLALLLRDAHEYLADGKHDLLIEMGRRFTQRGAEVFQAAIDAGEIAADVPADLLAAMHQGMCVALLNRRAFTLEAAERMPATPASPAMYSGSDRQRLAEMLVSVLLDGIVRTSTVSRPPPPATASDSSSAPASDQTS
jgi:AcrR family transcriptional regulator